MSESVSGTDEAPGTLPTVAVSGALAAAAALVAGAGGNVWWARVGRFKIATILGVRGVAGLTGNTDKLVGWKTSSHFKDLDRRYYGPISLTLALLVLVASWPARSRRYPY